MPRGLVAASVALLLGLPAPASAYRPPKNHRRGRRVAAPEAARAAKVPAARWTPQVRAALEAMLAVHHSSAAAYDPRRPPVAVISWEGGGLIGDPAEAVFFSMVTNAEMRQSDGFWLNVPIAYGRQRIRAAFDQFSSLPRAVWESQPAYKQYRKAFLESYQLMCAKVGRKECRSYLTKLFHGFTDEEASGYARGVLSRELSVPAAEELIGESEGDPAPARWRRGLAVVPEVKSLVEVLRGAGFDVWALGLEAQPVLEAAAELGGVDSTRCLGIKQGHDREKLNGLVREPVPIRGGAVEAVVSALGRAPVLLVAASAEDEELLSYGAGLRVLLDRGDGALRERALKGGTLIQPAFGPPRAAKP